MGSFLALRSSSYLSESFLSWSGLVLLRRSRLLKKLSSEDMSILHGCSSAIAFLYHDMNLFLFRLWECICSFQQGFHHLKEFFAIV